MAKSQTVPLNQALAYIIAAIFVLCPLFAYRDGPAMFGASALSQFLHLALITTAGGTAGMVAVVNPGERFLATFPGLLAGAGVAVAWCYLLHSELPPSLLHSKLAIIVALVGGATPGFLLLSLLRKVVGRRGVVAQQGAAGDVTKLAEATAQVWRRP